MCNICFDVAKNSIVHAQYVYHLPVQILVLLRTCISSLIAEGSFPEEKDGIRFISQLHFT